MNGYEKSVALNITGTDTDVVAVLKTLTVGDIPVAHVRTWMREHLIWYRGSDGLMKGSLATAYATALTGQQVSLDYLHATVWGDSATVLRTTDPFWAPQVAQLVGLVAALVPAVATLVDEFYDLDGGRPYLDLTAVEFAAQRTAAADAVSFAAIRTTALATLQSQINPIQGKLNAIDGWLTTEVNLALSAVDYQALTDQLMATEDGNPV